MREIRVVVMQLPLGNRNLQFIDRSMKQKEPLFVGGAAALLVVLGPPGVTELPPDRPGLKVESREEGGGALSRRFARTNERGIDASFNMQAREGGREGVLLP